MIRELKKGQRAKRLARLSELAKQVMYDANETPLVRMSLVQQKALDSVLRWLDLSNRYAMGDRLRRAFGIELDTAEDRAKGDRAIAAERRRQRAAAIRKKNRKSVYRDDDDV